MPIGAEANFRGVVDLLKMKALVWDGDDKGAKFQDADIPADLADKAAEYRAAMIEAAVELDDDAMSAYLDGKEPDVDTLRRLIRKAAAIAKRTVIDLRVAAGRRCSGASQCR